MFDSESVYLPTKKIGKNNPRAAEIEADNAARQEWNRTADLALVSGIEEVKILAVKKEKIQEKTSESIKQNGWLPKLFRSIVGKAKELLRDIIRSQQLPPKPVLSIDMDEYRVMQKPIPTARKAEREKQTQTASSGEQTAPHSQPPFPRQRKIARQSRRSSNQSSVGCSYVMIEVYTKK